MKFLSKILFILLIITALSCERKPLYLQGDYLLNVSARVEADINTMWRTDWRDSLKFDWKTEYGSLGYTDPGIISLIPFYGSEMLDKYNIRIGRRQYVDLNPNESYDLLLYNKTLNIDASYRGGRYYIESFPVSTGVNSSISEQYTTINQPGEVFSTYIKNVYLNELDYEIVFENGKNIYVYNIDAVLNPVSYIYVIQFIVINDDNSPYIEARDIQGFTISGVTAKKNLFTGKSVYTGRNQIEMFDVKDGQMRGDSLIFASRITVLDLLPEEEESSWTTHENHLYYTTLNVDTFDYGVVTGTKDITKQLNDNPHGGVITVKILNSELKHNSDGGDSDFGIDLDEWMEYKYDVI